MIDCASQALVWVYFEEKTRELYKLSLRTAHEVTSLVYALDLSNGDKKTLAEETLAEAAKALGMETKALENTLRLIEEDPFVRFLVAIWHWPKPALSVSAGKNLAGNAASASTVVTVPHDQSN